MSDQSNNSMMTHAHQPPMSVSGPSDMFQQRGDFERTMAPSNSGDLPSQVQPSQQQHYMGMQGQQPGAPPSSYPLQGPPGVRMTPSAPQMPSQPPQSGDGQNQMPQSSTPINREAIQKVS